MDDRHTVFVTGASGFIGSRLVRALDRSRFKVIGISRSGQVAGCDETLAVDLSQKVPELPGARPADTLVHLAAKAHDSKATAEDFARHTVDVAGNVASAVASSGLRRVVHVSSIGARVAAEDPAGAREYGRAKLAAEEAFERIAGAGGAQIVTLRPPAIYGAGAAGNFALLDRLVGSGLPLPFGAVDNRRSYLHLEDFTALISALCSLSDTAFEALSGGVFEPAESEAVSTRSVAQAMSQAKGRKPLMMPVPLAGVKFFGRLAGRSDQVDGAFGSLVAHQDRALEDATGWQPERRVLEELSRPTRSLDS